MVHKGPLSFLLHMRAHEPLERRKRTWNPVFLEDLMFLMEDVIILGTEDGSLGLFLFKFKREPSITKNDWPSTAEELIFQEAFNLPQDISFLLSFFMSSRHVCKEREEEIGNSCGHQLLFSFFWLESLSKKKETVDGRLNDKLVPTLDILSF